MTSIAQFNPDDNRQVASCAAGQACLLYTWKKSSTEIGSYRECFSTSIQLGHSSYPVSPAPSCELVRTQADPRSSIRACVCTQDFCNIVPDGRSEESQVVSLDLPRQNSVTGGGAFRVQ